MPVDGPPRQLGQLAFVDRPDRQPAGPQPVMFYNGATHDARWRIGWVAFDPMYSKIVDRCIEPLVVPPPAEDRSSTDIAFAASALVDDERRLTLYYSLEDRRLARAKVRGYFD